MAVFWSKAVGFFLLLSTMAVVCQAASPNGNKLTEQIVQGFSDFTDKSYDLREAVADINSDNAWERASSVAPGLAGIKDKIIEGIDGLRSATSGPLSDADAQLVVDALTTFVNSERALLAVVVGKVGLMHSSCPPIYNALVGLNAVLARFGRALMPLIPTKKTEAQKQFQVLKAKMENAITTYRYGWLKGSGRGLSNNPTTDKILQGFSDVTAMSDNLRVATSEITWQNVYKQGSNIPSGVTGIKAKISEGIAWLRSTTRGPLSDADARLVVDAITTFVNAQKALLKVMVGKVEVLSYVSDTIYNALVDLDADLAAFAWDLKAVIPTKKTEAEKLFEDLNWKLQYAEVTYKFGHLQGSGRLSNNPTTDSVTLASVVKD